MRSIYRFGDLSLPIDMSRIPEAGKTMDVVVDGESQVIEVVRIEGDEIVFRFADELVRARCAADGNRRWVHCSGAFPVVFDRDDGSKKRRSAGAQDGGLEATMHSQVIAVSATVGARVSRGDVLVTLEAMKMEMRVAAPFPGTVKSVGCKPGEVVERGRVLVEIEPDPSA